MRYNQLGRTGMFVSEICLGTMTFGASDQKNQWGAIASLEQQAADRIVERSLAAGVNFIDTADVYSSAIRAHPRPVAEKPWRAPPGRGHRDQDAWRHGRRAERTGFVARPHHGFRRGQPRTDADGPHRPLPDPRNRYRDADRRDAARARRSRFARAGALHRRVELACLAYRQGARHFREQGLCPLRDGAVLLFDRRTRPRARHRPADRTRRSSA